MAQEMKTEIQDSLNSGKKAIIISVFRDLNFPGTNHKSKIMIQIGSSNCLQIGL